MPFDTRRFGSRRTRPVSPLMSSKIRFRTSTRDELASTTPRALLRREQARLLRVESERLIATIIRYAPLIIR